MKKQTKKNKEDIFNRIVEILVILILLFFIIRIHQLFYRVDSRNSLINELNDTIEDLEDNIDKLNKDLKNCNSSLSEINKMADSFQSQLTSLLSTYIPKPDFLLIAEDVADRRDWIYNKYMCCDYARDLVRELKREGYKAKVEEGYWYYGEGDTCSALDEQRFECRHCWVVVEIPIEATQGIMIPIDEYRRDYK